MKNLILVLLFIPLISFGQDLFFMGESSFNSTKSIELSSESYGENIEVLFASNTDSKYIVVKRQIVLENSFAGKLIIYLNNGDVISLIEPFATDYTNRTVTGMYALTNQIVDKLKNTNINSIAYTLDMFGTKSKFSAKNINFLSTQQLKDF